MEPTRIFDIPYWQHEKFPKPDALVTKVNGTWKPVSTEEFLKIAEKMSYGFLALGITKGDTIASISTNNRCEFNYIDQGMLQIGVMHVPMYPTISDSDYNYILNDAGVKYIFVSDEALYNRVKEVVKTVPSVKGIYTYNEIAGANHWTEVLKLGEKNPQPEKLAELKKAVTPNDTATLIYTSGTTGQPKGVMLSHNNIISNVIDAHPYVPIKPQSRALSFLPLCHIYERMLNYLYQYSGISIYYAESIDLIGDNLREVKPHVFVAVPRVLEKIFDKIMATGNKLTGFKKFMFFWALEIGTKYEHYGANGWWYKMKLNVARKLVFSKWAAAVGGNLELVVSGGAALQPRLARVFWAAKIPILEGYGLTETSPVIAVNTLEPNGSHFGTVGPVIPGVTVKFAEDGEILCKGPNVMQGYYKQPEATREAIDADGWFHTGDIGTLVDNRFLKITDRKKALLKTSGGKYIAPQPIENKMKESRYIEQIMVIGDGQKFAAALIVPKYAELEPWCKDNNVTYTSHDDLVQNQKVHDLYRSVLDKYNAFFGHVEQVKKFELLAHEWTVAGGEITPKLDLKRKNILEKYKALVEKIYNSHEG
ncbi:MAG TPA: long-chain fatty acid--CoA ligase [Bacteroidia bacterium]|jgi:long-chain acyl-CoA synthetase|nr:long-chain fatty acid--CoA ligase [Bacteroidia bacterium]